MKDDLNTINKERYNAVGYHPMVDYRNSDYRKFLEDLQPFLEVLIPQGTRGARGVKGEDENEARKVRALEIGCNAGRYSFYMEELGAQVTGLDFAEVTIDTAREIALDLGSQCEFIVGNALNMTFEPGSFDLVLFPLNIVEFSYDDIDKMCSDLQGIISTNGSFCITMQDGMQRIVSGNDAKQSFEVGSGLTRDIHEIPGKGEFEYHCYFWTLAFAKHVIGRYFEVVNVVEYANNRFWLEFRNTR